MTRAIRYAIVDAIRCVHVRDCLTAIKATDLYTSFVSSDRVRSAMTTIGGESYVSIDCLEWLITRDDAPADLVNRIGLFLTAIDRAAA